MTFLGFKRPGLITGAFAFGYGISRFIIEYFRVPDPQFFTEKNPHGFAFSIAEFGLTMGQALTVPMIISGIALILYSKRLKYVGRI